MAEFIAPSGDLLKDLPYAHGQPLGTGEIRHTPEDFQVIEHLGYSATGEGEHVFLLIQKTGLTTNEVAGMLAKFAGVRKRVVSYAGLKDKQASTTQAFSVQMPGMPDPDWSALNSENLQVLSAQRHRKKIRRGSLRGNGFVLKIREAELDKDQLAQRLALISSQGVPNYFGPQRFGSAGGNLLQAQALFDGRMNKVNRQLKSILLSSVRSWLFNLVLAERVKQGNWNQALNGDVMLLTGSNQQFLAEPGDTALPARVDEFDITPSGPLCGQPSRCLQPQTDTALLEAILQDQQFWLQGLEEFGLMQDRRALRLPVKDLQHEWQQQDLLLSFSLPAGSYATTVLRELVDVDNQL